MTVNNKPLIDVMSRGKRNFQDKHDNYLSENTAPLRGVNWNSIEDSKDLEVWNKVTENFWLPEKIPVSNDISSWDTMTEEERVATMRVFTGLTLLDTLQGTVGATELMKDAVTQHEEAVLSNFAFMEAFAGNTELLTTTGWKKITDITTEDKVAQYEPATNTIDFTQPTIIPSHYSHDVYQIADNNGNTKQIVSSGHRVYFEQKVNNEWVSQTIEAKNLTNEILQDPDKRFRITGKAVDGQGLTQVDRLLIAINTIGFYDDYAPEKKDKTAYTLLLEEKDKIDTLRKLAFDTGWGLLEKTHNKNEKLKEFILYAPTEDVQNLSHGITEWWDLEHINATWAQEFITETFYWYNTTQKENNLTLKNVNHTNAEFLTIVTALAGHNAHKVNSEDNYYTVTIVPGEDYVSGINMSITTIDAQEVYCVQVPTTFLLTRNDGGGTVVSGNCVHAKSYSNIFMTLASTPMINEAFRWSEQNESLQKKAKIVNYYYEGDNPYKKKVASTILESFLFYSGFYLPLYWASHSKLTNTSDIIKLIIRDESIHGYYIGYKYQNSVNKLSDAEQEELKDYTYNLLYELYENECQYTEDIYDVLGLTDDVKRFLRYNANKALQNLGYDNLFPVSETKVSPSILSAISPNSNENHDFFSGSGSSYVIGTVEELTDDDWAF